MITITAKMCRSSISKRIGLMFSRKRTIAMVFDKEPIIPLHMMFVFYPIDVYFLNKDKVVVEIKLAFKPFTFYVPEVKAMYAVELPADTISADIGSIIDFEEVN